MQGRYTTHVTLAITIYQNYLQNCSSSDLALNSRTAFSIVIYYGKNNAIYRVGLVSGFVFEGDR